MRALVLCTLVAGVVLAGFLACNPNSIGRPCINPLGSDVRGTQVSSPALECPSRLCLIQKTLVGGVDGGERPRATCTAPCNSDGDCSPETDSLCKNGFVCAVAATAGPFCCRKLCVCRDDLEDNVNRDPNDGGVITPTSCRPDTANPECPNAPR
jgi:hypothetical protein